MIALPLRFKAVLEKDSNLYGIVNTTLSDFTFILEENSLYFFEEFTDHGIKHIQSVINSADEIIPKETFDELMTPQNTAFLILSIILHDLGMHTSFLSFKLMMDGSYDDIINPILDKKKWKSEWNEFLDKAKKFSSKETVNIFGKEDYQFSIPILADKDKLNGEDKKLIGEFIRRNHPRIAHEIAIKGIPSKGKFIDFAFGLEEKYRNIVGIIARSHGIDIRNTFSFLEMISKEEWSKPYNVDIIFLMVILRIADYFQFDNSRINPITVKLKTFNSPVSKQEFDKHLSIDFVKESSKDPETLFVQAKPDSSTLYLKLKDLLMDIQRELDLSWAILGEVYGKENYVRQPKIKYRRIKSNILTLDFQEQVSYVAKEVSFQTDEELSKLLIAPLYGNNPSYGVRELLQNSIDACIERMHLENTYKPEIEVKIYSENSQFYFIIKDNGKGMTLFEITDYFLKAGSSFRKSYDWQKKFTNDKGESKIQRSGRFGVGALAAFLLGSKMIITTKSLFDNHSYSFIAQLDSDQIEINKGKIDVAGTSILIPITKKIYEFLIKNESTKDEDIPKWTKWYAIRYPHIKYYIQNKKVDGFTKFNPAYSDQLPNDWHSLTKIYLDRVDWTFSSNYAEPKFTCNGIVIPKGYNLRRAHTGFHKLPIISTFDLNGKLPLNLNRNSVDGKLPFEDELIRDIYKDIIAKLLCTKVIVKDSILYLNQNFALSHASEFGYRAYYEHNDINSFLFCNDGFGLRYSYFLLKLKYEFHVIAYLENGTDLDYSLDKYLVSFEILKEENNYWYRKQAIDPYYNASQAGIITCKKSIFEYFSKSKSIPMRAGLKKT